MLKQCSINETMEYLSERMMLQNYINTTLYLAIHKHISSVSVGPDVTQVYSTDMTYRDIGQ